MVPRALGRVAQSGEAGWMRLHSNEDGQAIVEYGLVIGALSLALIAVFIVTGLDASFTALVQKIQAAFN
jgi:Flp pilus assembly pilin Flp